MSHDGVGARREAREQALSLLYEADAKGIGAETLLADQPVAPPEFVRALVQGVGDHGPRIDELISTYAVDWALDRMPVIDRSVLRLAVFELLEEPATPVAVVISEAVELAKQYSTEQSGRFVNGVLSSVAAAVR